MAEVGRIQIEVDARQVDQAIDSLNQMGITASRAGKKVDGYEKQTKQATKASDKMARSSRKLTRMFGLLSAGLGGLTFIGLARNIESATTQMNNIEATMRVAAGSSEAAGKQLAFIREESERLGLFFPTVAKQMAQFSAAARGTSITSEELKTIFTGISEASRAMGLTAPEAEGAMKALQQMMSKGKVSAEELRQQLGERMPGSIQIMAASLDVTTQELFKMMENGELLSDEVLPKFGRELQKVFGGEASEQAEKIAASIQRLQTAFFELMSQGDLSGAAEAIDELAVTISSPAFQESFDAIVQSMSELAAVAARNIDTITLLLKALAAGATIRAIYKLATNLRAVAGALALLTGPAGQIAALIGIMGTVTSQFLDARDATKAFGDELDTLTTKQMRAELETLEQVLFRLQTEENRNLEFFETANQRKKIRLTEERIEELKKALAGIPKKTETEVVVGPEELPNVDLTKQAITQQQKLLSTIKKTGTEGERIYEGWESALMDISSVIEDDVSDGLTDIIMQAESAKDVFASLADQIARTIIQQQIADPLAESITGAATSFAGSLFGGPGTQSIGGGAPPTVRGIGPPAANGGNVFSNKAHLVGERGPEMFVPGQDGRIIPNSQMGGGGNVTVNVINQGGEKLQAEQQQSRRGANGEMTVDVMVKSSIERLDGQGQLDGVFRRHGAARQGQF